MYVYFIRECSVGSIKIGYSHDVSKRMRDIQMCLPQKLEFLGVIEGGKAEESALHDKFEHLRIHGEWFKADDELLDFIKHKAAQEMPVSFAKQKSSPTLNKRGRKPILADKRQYFVF